LLLVVDMVAHKTPKLEILIWVEVVVLVAVQALVRVLFQVALLQYLRKVTMVVQLRLEVILALVEVVVLEQ
jgi:hypothetical protein